MYYTTDYTDQLKFFGGDNINEDKSKLFLNVTCKKACQRKIINNFQIQHDVKTAILQCRIQSYFLVLVLKLL